MLGRGARRAPSRPARLRARTECRCRAATAAASFIAWRISGFCSVGVALCDTRFAHYASVAGRPVQHYARYTRVRLHCRRIAVDHCHGSIRLRPTPPSTGRALLEFLVRATTSSSRQSGATVHRNTPRHRRHRLRGPARDHDLSPRAKVKNLRQRSAASACVLSDEWNGPWVQLDGTAEVLDLPDALEPLVEYFPRDRRRAFRLGRVPGRDAATRARSSSVSRSNGGARSRPGGFPPDCHEPESGTRPRIPVRTHPWSTHPGSAMRARSSKSSAPAGAPSKNSTPRSPRSNARSSTRFRSSTPTRRAPRPKPTTRNRSVASRSASRS